MEIYRDKTGQGVDLGITGATNISAVFKKGTQEIAAVVNATTAGIPYAVVQSDGTWSINWTYTVESAVYTRSEELRVVTPLFNKADLVAEEPTFASSTDAQIARLESFVRNIIETYTGQTFGLEKGSIDIYGDGTSVMHSHKRIVSIDTPYTDYPYRLVMDGYGIEISNGYFGEIAVPTIEAGEPYRRVITNPYVRKPFSNNVKYAIAGTFGWASVPEEVKHAAIVLAGSFSCKEAGWRDKYLKAIRAADWSFEYNSGAYRGTGSASADMLLSKFIVNRVAVI